MPFWLAYWCAIGVGAPLKLKNVVALCLPNKGCIDLSIATMHLKDPKVKFGSEGCAPTLWQFAFNTLCIHP